MSAQLEKSELSAEERALLVGDLKALNPQQRSSLYMRVCQSLGLNPLTKPFDYIELGGKLTFYASRNCTDQLRQIHNVSVKITSRERLGDIYVVTAQATTPQGRVDESTGAVSISNLKGDHLANAIMKAETKSKRRVTLSICGLSFLDESEIETIKDAKKSPSEIMPSQPSPPHASPPEVVSTELIEATQGQDPVDWRSYVVGFGKFKGKRLEEIGFDQAESYAHWLIHNAESKGQALSGSAEEYCAMIEAWSSSLDQSNMPPIPTEPPPFDVTEEIPF